MYVMYSACVSYLSKIFLENISVIPAQDIELDALQTWSNTTGVQINDIFSGMVDLNATIERLEKENTGISHTSAYLPWREHEKASLN